MTHDELLAKIAVKGNHPFATLQYNEVGQTDIQAAFSALRAVVAIHKPVYWQGIEMVCDWCDIRSYPCPTIEAIEKELA